MPFYFAVAQHPMLFCNHVAMLCCFIFNLLFPKTSGIIIVPWRDVSTIFFPFLTGYQRKINRLHSVLLLQRFIDTIMKFINCLASLLEFDRQYLLKTCDSLKSFFLLQSVYQWIIKPQSIIKANEMFLPGRMAFIYNMVWPLIFLVYKFFTVFSLFV